jgi:hypothetical protein
VGLGTEQGWTQKLANRLQKLATTHGVDLSHASDDEEEAEGQGAAAASSGGSVCQLPCRAVEARCWVGGRLRSKQPGRKIPRLTSVADTLGCASVAAAAACSAELSEEEEAPAAGGRRQPKKQPAARKPAAKQQQQSRARKPVRQKKAAAEDVDWGAGMSEASSASSDDAESEREGDAPRPGSARAARGGSAQGAAREAALAATELPFRRRLKNVARAAAAAAAAEAGASTPAGSSAASGGLRQRLGSAASRELSKISQSVASNTPGSGLVIPKRSAGYGGGGGGGGSTPFGGAWSAPKRRSEIDRRLDELVNTSGRLRWVVWVGWSVGVCLSGQLVFGQSKCQGRRRRGDSRRVHRKQHGLAA